LVTGEVAELELLLHPTDRISGTALPDHNDQRTPCVGANDTVDAKAPNLLEGADSRVGQRPEYAIHSHTVPSRKQEVLQRANRMFSIALADQRPWAK